VEKFGEAPNGHLKVKRNRSFQFSGVEEGTKELLRISHLRSKKVCQIAVDLCVFVFFQPRESHRICAHRNVVQVEALRDIFCGSFQSGTLPATRKNTRTNRHEEDM
jgi:hypothetical protein